MIRTFLESAEYEARIASHEERAAGFVEPHLARRRRAQKHPVWDFLFDYYRFRPTHLKKWHPAQIQCFSTPLRFLKLHGATTKL